MDRHQPNSPVGPNSAWLREKRTIPKVPKCRPILGINLVQSVNVSANAPQALGEMLVEVEFQRRPNQYPDRRMKNFECFQELIRHLVAVAVPGAQAKNASDAFFHAGSHLDRLGLVTVAVLGHPIERQAGVVMSAQDVFPKWSDAIAVFQSDFAHEDLGKCL